MTDTELATLSGVSQATITRARNGTISRVRLVTMLGIAAGMGASVRLHDVMEPTDDKPLRDDLVLTMHPAGSPEWSDPVAAGDELRVRLRREFADWKSRQQHAARSVISLAEERDFSAFTASEVLHDHRNPGEVRGTVTSFAGVAKAFGLDLQLRVEG